MREPSVTFTVIENIGNYLIINLPERNDTQIIRLDKDRGYPSFKGIPGYDIFPDILTAKKFLRQAANRNSISFHEYYMVAGIFPIGSATIIAFITNVNKAGNILGHDVYSLAGIRFALANIHQLQPNEQRALTQIISIGNNQGQFICHTTDISYPINATKTDECLWNRSIMKPFDFFPLGKVCPDIISGTFNAKNFGDYTVYCITRIVSETCGPADEVRGTTDNGMLGNMASVEVIVSKKIGISREFYSSVILRGTVPIAFSRKTGRVSNPPYSGLPMWIHKTTSNYSIDNINIFDLGHSACKGNEPISSALQESVEFVKYNFNIKLKQLDWCCMKKDKMGSAAVSSIKESVALLFKDDFYSHGFVDRERVSFDIKQKSSIITTSPNGIDRAAIGAFIVASTIADRLIKMANVNEKLNDQIISFLALSSIISSDVIARQSVGTDALCHNDIVSLSKILTKNRSVPIQKDKVILIERKKNSYEDRAKMFALGILAGKEQKPFLPSRFPSVSTLTTCLSDIPNARVISPACGTQILRQIRTTYNTNDGPLVILLSEPCYVTEISIKVPSTLEHFSAPSSFTVYGGPYANRLFPIFEDCAIPSNESNTNLSYKHSTKCHYSHESIAHSLSLIRFLVFYFESIQDEFVLDGIKVYGKRELPLQTNSYSAPLAPVISNPVFWEEPCFETFIMWEERRLCSLMSVRDYLFEIAKKEMNPGNVLSENIFKLLPSGLSHDYVIPCSVCGKPADFKCGLCRKPFCRRCMKVNESHDQISDPHSICQLCTPCMERRYRFSANISRLIALNDRMVREKFSFIDKEEGKFFSSDPILLYQVPFGTNNVSFERMMMTGESWEPIESITKVDLIFKQFVNIKSFCVNCNTEFYVMIENSQYLCRPPFQRFQIDYKGSSMTLNVIGENVSMTSISFETSPLVGTLPTVERKFPTVNFQVIRSKSTNVTARSMTLTPMFDTHVMPIAGVEFSEAAPIKSFACFITTENGPKFFRFCLPRFRGTERVLFPMPIKCSEVILYFTETYETFSLPQVKLLLIL